MGELESKTLQYTMKLVPTDNIKVLLNDNEVFNQTVNTGNKGRIKLHYYEGIDELSG